MSLREITGGFGDTGLAQRFFAWCSEHGVHLQHILYSADELEQFLDYRERGIVPATQRCLLFVLGRYRADFQSQPENNLLLPNGSVAPNTAALVTSLVDEMHAAGYAPADSDSASRLLGVRAR